MWATQQWRPSQPKVCVRVHFHGHHLPPAILVHYTQEYFTRILKKLKEVGATADRTNFYV